MCWYKNNFSMAKAAAALMFRVQICFLFFYIYIFHSAGYCHLLGYFCYVTENWFGLREVFMYFVVLLVAIWHIKLCYCFLKPWLLFISPSVLLGYSVPAWSEWNAATSQRQNGSLLSPSLGFSTIALIGNRVKGRAAVIASNTVLYL